MYALRYGAIPIVRSICGLKDTVIDISEENGFGICHDEVNVDEMTAAIAILIAATIFVVSLVAYRLMARSVPAPDGRE